MRATRPIASVGVIAVIAVVATACGSQVAQPSLPKQHRPVPLPRTAADTPRHQVGQSSLPEQHHPTTLPRTAGDTPPHQVVQSSVPKEHRPTPPHRVVRATPRPPAKAGRSPFGGISALTRPRRPSDGVSSSAAGVLTRYPHQLSGGRAIRAASARRVLPSPYPAWLVTNGHNSICLLQEAPVRGGTAPGQSVICLPAARALRGWLMSTLTGAPGERGTLVQGVVPNGVAVVTVRTSDGQARPVTVRTNAYSFTASHPESVTYDVRGKRYTVPVPGPPARGSS